MRTAVRFHTARQRATSVRLGYRRFPGFATEQDGALVLHPLWWMSTSSAEWSLRPSSRQEWW
jgi:hypothetical protein